MRYACERMSLDRDILDGSYYTRAHALDIDSPVMNITRLCLLRMYWCYEYGSTITVDARDNSNRAMLLCIMAHTVLLCYFNVIRPTTVTQFVTQVPQRCYNGDVSFLWENGNFDPL